MIFALVILALMAFLTVILGITLYAMVKNFGKKDLPESPPPPVLPVTFTSARSMVLPFAVFMTFLAVVMAAGTILVIWEWPPPGFESPVGFLLLLLGSTAALSWGAYSYVVRMLLPDMLTLSTEGLWCRVGGKIRQWSWPEIADAKVFFTGRSPPVVLVLQQNERGVSPQVLLGNMWPPLSSRGSAERDMVDVIRAVLAQRNGGQPITAQPSG